MSMPNGWGAGDCCNVCGSCRKRMGGLGSDWIGWQWIDTRHYTGNGDGDDTYDLCVVCFRSLSKVYEDAFGHYRSLDHVVA